MEGMGVAVMPQNGICPAMWFMRLERRGVTTVARWFADNRETSVTRGETLQARRFVNTRSRYLPTVNTTEKSFTHNDLCLALQCHRRHANG